MKEVRATPFAPVLWGLDRLFPVPLLLGLIYPAAWIRALVHRLWTGARGVPRRPCWLPDGEPFNPLLLDRLSAYLTRLFEFLPDRLAPPSRYGIPLIVAAIYTEGPWRFVIELSPSVDAEPWKRGDEAVGAERIGKLLPVLRRYPHQCEPGLVDRFQPAQPQPRQIQAA